MALTFRAKDAAGNSCTSGGLSVAFTQSGGALTGTIGSVTNKETIVYGLNGTSNIEDHQKPGTVPLGEGWSFRSQSLVSSGVCCDPMTIL